MMQLNIPVTPYPLSIFDVSEGKMVDATVKGWIVRYVQTEPPAGLEWAKQLCPGHWIIAVPDVHVTEDSPSGGHKD